MLRSMILFCACVWLAAASDVTGKWAFTAQANGHEYKAELLLRNDGGQLGGTMSNAEGTTQIQDVKLTGNELSYKIVTGGQEVYEIKLIVSGDTMKGTYAGPNGAAGPVTATRAAATAPAATSAGSVVTGKWHVTARGADGNETSVDLELTDQGGKLSGTLSHGNGSAALQDVSLAGSNLTFKVPVRGAVYTVKLTLAGNALTGSFESAEGQKGALSATR
jgi:hypothetical protein